MVSHDRLMNSVDEYLHTHTRSNGISVSRPFVRSLSATSPGCAHSVSNWSCLAAAGGAPRVGQPGWACGHARQPCTPPGGSRAYAQCDDKGGRASSPVGRMREERKE